MVKHSFRILVTEQCNASCANCFNSTLRTGSEIEIHLFEKLCAYLALNKINRLKIMGGEPTVHSQFEDIIGISQQYFDSVIIFTNAVNDRIKNISPRRNDTIVYNSDFINDNFDPLKLLLEKDGHRRFEIQISKDCLVDRIKTMLKTFKNTPIRYNLTLNCMEDIFQNRIKLSEKWHHITAYITHELKKDYSIDHHIPFCLSKLFDSESKCNMCNIECSGLIDSNLNLRYCNQHPLILCKLFQPNGEFVKFSRLIEYLENEYNAKAELNKNLKCQNCHMFMNKCNGGCFVHKLVAANTDH